jgi:CBS domain-containing protein
MRTVRQLLADKPAAIHTVAADDPVRTAIERMAEHHVGALPVMEGERLVGIVSERDYARKVVLMGRNSLETRVRTIMSVPVVSVGRHQTVGDCMRIMTERRFRHLPVVEEGRLIGVISIGDCVKAVIDEQQHEIEDLKRYIAG